MACTLLRKAAWLCRRQLFLRKLFYLFTFFGIPTGRPFFYRLGKNGMPQRFTPPPGSAATAARTESRTIRRQIRRHILHLRRFGDNQARICIRPHRDRRRSCAAHGHPGSNGRAAHGVHTNGTAACRHQPHGHAAHSEPAQRKAAQAQRPTPMPQKLTTPTPNPPSATMPVAILPMAMTPFARRRP